MDPLVRLEIARSTGKHTKWQEPIHCGIMMASMVQQMSDISIIMRPAHVFSGLIRYKIVIHCFIDGKSRYVTGIRAHNNNRAKTVVDLFLEAVDTHGLPSRVRGDHGTENVLVAACMEERRGVERGSYIWGR